MERNVGDTDRTARVAAGAALLGAGIATPGPVRSAVSVGAGGMMLATGATGRCPAYSVLGIDTTEDDPDGGQAIPVEEGAD